MEKLDIRFQQLNIPSVSATPIDKETIEVTKNRLNHAYKDIIAEINKYNGYVMVDVNREGKVSNCRLINCPEHIFNKVQKITESLLKSN